MTYKLDLFNALLPAIDRRNKDFYSKLTDEEKKGFAPPVALRAASGVKDGPSSEHYIWLVNERANVNWHDIWEHPELQYKLLASCGYGSRQNHEFLPMPQKKGRRGDQVGLFLSQFWPDANDFELELLINQFTEESFEEFVRVSGSTPDEEKEVLEAYGRLIGKVKPKPKGKSKKA